MKKLLKTLLTLTLVIACVVVTNLSQTTVYAATTAQKKALKEAKSYLKDDAWSKKSLKEQLVFNGYTKKEANYAVNKCGANWEKQAKKEAKASIKMTLDPEWKEFGIYYSKKSMIDWLKFNGFTKNQAKYGANKCGANWKKQAVIAAKVIMETDEYSETELKKELKKEGFTKAQIKHALKKVGF